MLRDKRRGVYKRMVLEGNKVCGAVLFGDVSEASGLRDLIADKTDIGADPRSAAVRYRRRCGVNADSRRAPPARTAASAAACWPRRADGRRGRGARRSGASGQSRQAVLEGHALGETLGLEDRLLHPHGARRARDAGTPRIATVARRFRATASASTDPMSVAFYVSGQLLTEDYYVANKLMKGFIGTANIDTNSRLCMASAVAGHKRAFGEDVVPVSYEDLDARRSHRARRFEHRLVSPDHPAAHPRGAREARPD